MDKKESKFLEEIAKKAGLDPSKMDKKAFGNPLENSMFANAIKAALVGLEVVAIGTLDIKLTAIVKLLQSWIKDREEELAQKQQQEYGYQESYQDDSFGYNVNIGGYY